MVKINSIRMIAIYGKAGIGKSIISSNISAALSHMGERVMQVGCDPKRDSILTLCGQLKPTILERTATCKNITDEVLKSVIFEGYNGVLGVEAGGPKPGVGCAGRGVALALKLLKQFKIFEEYKITFVIFDVLGDVVCGGFAQPMREGFAKETYVIVNAELLSMFQTNNILRSIRKICEEGREVGLAGLIHNARGIRNEEEIVEEFAEMVKTKIIHHIPRSEYVQKAEVMGKTVIEAFPDSPQAEHYRKLARKIRENREVAIPTPLDYRSAIKQIKELIAKYT